MLTIKHLIPATLSFILLSAFTPQVTSSIVGKWMQTEAIHIVRRAGGSQSDTTVSHDRGFAITFTADSQYHYTAPYGHHADGTYILGDDMLREISAASHTSADYKILFLSDHALKLQTTGTESGKATETVTSYMR